MIDLLGPDLEQTLGVNPAFSGARSEVRTAFLKRFVREDFEEGVVYEPGDPPLDRIRLFGTHTALQLGWKDGDLRSSSNGYYGDTIGTEFCLPPGLPSLRPTLDRINSVSRGLAWSLPFTAIPDIRQEIGDEATDAVLTTLAQGEWLATSPMLARTLNLDRVALGRSMIVRPVKAGDVICDSGGDVTGLIVLLPGLLARVDRTREDGSTITYEQGFGSMFAHRPTERPAGQARVVVTAQVDGYILYLRRRTMVRILANPFGTARGELQQLLAALAQRVAAADAFVTSLRRSRLFGGVAEAQLYPLLQGTIPSRWRPRFTAPAPFGDISGVAAVIGGELLSYRVTVSREPSHNGGAGARLHTLSHYGPLDVIGDRDMALGYELASHWMARLPSQTLFLPGRVVNDTLSDDPAYEQARAAVVASALLEDEIAGKRIELGSRRAEAVLVGTADGGSWTRGLDALLSGGMFSIYRQFDEYSRCVLLRLVSGPGTPVPESHDPVGWCTMEVTRGANDSETARNIAAAIRETTVSLGSVGISNVFVRMEGEGLPAAQMTAAAFDRVIYFETNVHGIERRPLPAGVPLVFVALLPMTNAECQGAWYPPSTVRLRVNMGAIQARAQTNPDWAWDPQAVYEHAGPEPEVRDGLELDFPSQMHRLGRGLTDRRVGLALSGGESWGFGHYAVLGALMYRGVPIDILSGASVGSVIGGYFCLNGLDGLQSFISERAKVMAISMASIGTSTLFEHYLDRAFGQACLEGLDRQLIPVATNLQMSCPEPILAGRVAWGCRLSGSLVPAYASTPTETATFLDGAFSDNLPVEALRVEGARLIVSSNVMSPSSSTEAWPPLLPGLLGRVLSDLNPIRRLTASYQGVLTLAFAAGGASANSADRAFQFDRVGVGLFNLLDSPQIVHRALSQPDLWETLYGVETRWQAICAPRRARDGVAVIDDS